MPPFPVVLLDEATQMTEPLSLVPLLRARAAFLIAAGDPQQLPPVLASPAEISAPPAVLSAPTSQAAMLQAQAGQAAAAQQHGMEASGASGKHGLLRPLFVRLQHMGTHVHLLRTQYRCHPALSAVPSRCYYKGQLIDGCSEADRAALDGVPLPALTFCNNTSPHQQMYGSSVNEVEAQIVSRVVVALLQRGVQPGDMGVICFFKRQVGPERFVT